MEDCRLVHSRDENFLFATTCDVVCAPAQLVKEFSPADLSVNLTGQAGDEVKNAWT
jgi:hypothetical protein